MNSYFTYAISILTVLVACSTFVVGYSQAKIASAKVKLDLYERRFNVYISALNFCRAFYTKEPEEIKEYMFELVRSCRESKFLFKEEDGIYEILNTIKETGDLFNSYTAYVKSNGILDLNNPYKEALKNAEIFEKNLKDLEEKIKPYIQFKTIQGWTFF